MNHLGFRPEQKCHESALECVPSVRGGISFGQECGGTTYIAGRSPPVTQDDLSMCPETSTHQPNTTTVPTRGGEAACERGFVAVKSQIDSIKQAGHVRFEGESQMNGCGCRSRFLNSGTNGGNGRCLPNCSHCACCCGPSGRYQPYLRGYITSYSGG